MRNITKNKLRIHWIWLKKKEVSEIIKFIEHYENSKMDYDKFEKVEVPKLLDGLHQMENK